MSSSGCGSPSVRPALRTDRQDRCSGHVDGCTNLGPGTDKHGARGQPGRPQGGSQSVRDSLASPQKADGEPSPATAVGALKTAGGKASRTPAQSPPGLVH